MRLCDVCFLRHNVYTWCHQWHCFSSKDRTMSVFFVIVCRLRMTLPVTLFPIQNLPMMSSVRYSIKQRIWPSQDCLMFDFCMIDLFFFFFLTSKDCAMQWLCYDDLLYDAGYARALVKLFHASLYDCRHRHMIGKLPTLRKRCVFLTNITTSLWCGRLSWSFFFF